MSRLLLTSALFLVGFAGSLADDKKPADPFPVTDLPRVKPLGPAEGPVKTAIFSGNTTRLYGLERHAELTRHDRLAALKADYVTNGPGRSNLRYGYVTRPA